MKGSFKIVVSREGKVVYDLAFENMILASGIDLILDKMAADQNTSLVDTVFFGDGTTPPTFTDTTLSGARVGAVKLTNVKRTKGYNHYDSEFERGNRNIDGDFMHHQLDFVSTATTFASISEIATGCETEEGDILFSKTLIRDGYGNVTQMHVAPGDAINVRYTVSTFARNGSITREASNSELGKAPLFSGLRTSLSRWGMGSLSNSDIRVGCTHSITIENKDHQKQEFEVVLNFRYASTAPALTSSGPCTIDIPMFGYLYTVTYHNDSMRNTLKPDVDYQVRVRVNMRLGVLEALSYRGFYNLGDAALKSIPPSANVRTPSVSVRPFTYSRDADDMYTENSGVNEKFRLSIDRNRYSPGSVSGEFLSSALVRAVLAYPQETSVVEEGWSYSQKNPGDPILLNDKLRTIYNLGMAYSEDNILLIQWYTNGLGTSSHLDRYDWTYNGTVLEQRGGLVYLNDAGERIRIAPGEKIIGTMRYTETNTYLPRSITLTIPDNVNDFYKATSYVDILQSYRSLPSREDRVVCKLTINKGVYVPPVKEVN